MFVSHDVWFDLRWRAANGSIWQMLYTTSTTKSLPLGTTQVAHGLIWRDRAGSNGTDWDGEWENKTHCAVRKLPSRPVKTLIKPRGSPRFRPPSHFIPFDPTLSRQITPIWYLTSTRPKGLLGRDSRIWKHYVCRSGGFRTRHHARGVTS